MSGRLPLISVVVAFGTLLVAIADTYARNGNPLADLFFWGGILVVSLPIAARLLSEEPSRGERIGLVVLLAVALYLVKVMHSPGAFSLFDEFHHLRTVQDIGRTGHLFSHNPLLPVAGLYPGLAITTIATADLTGASFHDAGLAVIAVARLLLALGLFVFYEQLTKSPFLASIGAVIYMANPSFVFFDAQFAYESLGLALAMIVLCLLQRRQDAPPTLAPRLTVAAVVATLATVVTHHLSAFALTAFLFVWAIAARKTEGRSRRGVADLALFALLASTVWIVVVARQTGGYLIPRILDTIELLRLLAGEIPFRELFVSPAGPPPIWEPVVALGAAALISAVVLVGALDVRSRFFGNGLAVALTVAALAYPATLVLRLTSVAAEEASRAPEFLFLGVGFVAAVAVGPRLELQARNTLPRRRYAATAATVAAAAVLFVGGITLGFPRWARMPGPYLVSADSRSVEAEGTEAARWAARQIGAHNRITADRINRLLMGTHGMQEPITAYGDGIRTWQLFYTPEFGSAELAILRDASLQYVVVDLRLTTGAPYSGVYFEDGEPVTTRHDPPLSHAGLNKFDHFEGASRIFDSGAIRIYKVHP